MHIKTEFERTLEVMKNNPCCVNVVDEERKASIDEIAQDALITNVDEMGVWRQDEYMRLHPEKFNDSVDHPQHYTNGEIECKDAIKSALTPEEYRGWIKGNAIKYVWRERYKGGTEDLAKARNFLSWLGDE